MAKQKKLKQNCVQCAACLHGNCNRSSRLCASRCRNEGGANCISRLRSGLLSHMAMMSPSFPDPGWAACAARLRLVVWHWLHGDMQFTEQRKWQPSVATHDLPIGFLSLVENRWHQFQVSSKHFPLSFCDRTVDQVPASFLISIRANLH